MCLLNLEPCLSHLFDAVQAMVYGLIIICFPNIVNIHLYVFMRSINNQSFHYICFPLLLCIFSSSSADVEHRSRGRIRRASRRTGQCTVQPRRSVCTSSVMDRSKRNINCNQQCNHAVKLYYCFKFNWSRGVFLYFSSQKCLFFYYTMCVHSKCQRNWQHLKLVHE